MSQASEYIVGTSPVPRWLRGKLLPYKKMTGETGYEYRYTKRHALYIVELNPGDSLILYAGQIYYSRRKDTYAAMQNER